jgi:hypothetical protein
MCIYTFACHAAARGRPGRRLDGAQAAANAANVLPDGARRGLVDAHAVRHCGRSDIHTISEAPSEPHRGGRAVRVGPFGTKTHKDTDNFLSVGDGTG